MISVFDIFKIGIGPSSSHTVGPMKAGCQFLEELEERHLLDKIDQIKVDVYGSLSLTGRGHSTDIAIIMGLAGYSPEDVDIDMIPGFIANLKQTAILDIACGKYQISFDFDHDMIFHTNFLPLHENGMKIHALVQGEKLYSQTYYSIGGGFIVNEANFYRQETNAVTVPYPYKSAEDILKHCQDTGLSIASIAWENEIALRDEEMVKEHLQKIWITMWNCIQHGMNTEGILPGPLKLPRRAAPLRHLLESHNSSIAHDPITVIEWINMFALAVNEENAAGGRVVTAPPNGACGIVPAVLAYYQKFSTPLTEEIISRYLLTCSMIGSLYKMNASISGAEVGCQGEVGVACSMAAAGLAELLGGSPAQVCSAAEIGMEHNLGLTCDPVNGQVQVPCIERNAIASVKAINAAQMAIHRISSPSVSLDKVIETMYETGKDMNVKYRETSTGGLATKFIPCG